jgi:HSP20 family molecular chaperone IbpA
MSQDEEELEEHLQQVQKRMDRLFSDVMPSFGVVTARQQRNWRPPTDVYETETSVVVKVEIAGMSERDFAVSLSNRTLTVSGVRRDIESKLSYQQLEIPYGHFSTEVFLPYSVERNEIGATYENGFLTVTLPKLKPRRVPIVDRTAQHDGES